MSVIVYRSTDTSAPVLDGQAGSLTTLLDAVLVNGYGSKAAAGWSIAFTTTNKRVYRQGSPSAGVPPRQMDLDVDDTGPNATSTTKEARVRGYDQASAIGAGSNAFPASGTNICWRKSVATGATTRTWMIIADATTIYFFAKSEGTGDWFTGFFGEFYSYASGDNYKTMLCGRAENSSSNQIGAVNGFSTLAGTNSGVPQTIPSQYMARDYAGLNIGSLGGKIPFFGYAPSFPYTGAIIMPYPNGADGAILMSPIGILSGAVLALHGEMRGSFYLPHIGTNFSDQDTFSGSGALAGRTFIIIGTTDKYNPNVGGGNGYMVVETTDWPRST